MRHVLPWALWSLRVFWMIFFFWYLPTLLITVPLPGSVRLVVVPVVLLLPWLPVPVVLVVAFLSVVLGVVLGVLGVVLVLSCIVVSGVGPG